MRIFTTLLLILLASINHYVYPQWIQVPSAPTGYINDILIVNDTFYLAHGSSGVYRSVDNALTWELLDQGLNNMQAKNVNQLLFKGDTLFAATTDGIYRSLDGGENWVKKSNGILVGNGAIYAFTLSIYNHNGVLLTGAYTGIYRSEDWGDTWEATNVTGMHVYPHFFINHNGILFGARETNNSPYGYQSTDGGLTWSDMTIDAPTICFLSEPGKLWAGTVFGVYLSEDDGVTWEQRNNGLSLDPYSAGLLRVGDQLFTSLKFGGSGMYRSFDNGLNWEDFSDGLGFFISISKIVLHDNILFVITSNGLWERELNITDVAEQSSTPVKSLTQNYPNPFTNQTNIHFELNEAGHVRLEILNQQGSLITTLADQPMQTGNYHFSWNGKNHSGQPTSPGIYIYRLIKNDRTETGRIVKVR